MTARGDGNATGASCKRVYGCDKGVDWSDLHTGFVLWTADRKRLQLHDSLLAKDQ